MINDILLLVPLTPQESQRMKYGMNLLLWSGEITEAHYPVLEELKKMGFDGVEVPIFNLDADYAALGKKLDSLGLERTAVSVRTEADNPISPDAAVRAKGLELNKKLLDCCAAAGVQTLVGPYHSALGFFPGHSRTDDEWKWDWKACERWRSMRARSM